MRCMVRGRDLFRKYKPVINLLTKFTAMLPQRVRRSLLAHYRKSGGRKGMVIRYILLKTLCKSIGDNVSIHPDVYILNESKLSIGNNVSVHPMCYIDAVGGVIIENDASIAHRCSIISFNHRYDDLNTNIKEQPIEADPIFIGSNVWIGANCCILSGVRIESGCVVGAGTVMTKSTEYDFVYVGIPGKKIASRNSNR